MSNQFKTLEIIGAILSFKYDTHLLKATLLEESTNWDEVVKLGSSQLVLPTIYCRLKEKNLLNCLPDDLIVYLEEITTINRNRNLGILNEVQEISELFKKHQINHVFLKGSALLAGNYYKDIGERMLGDIDVLVASNQLQKAYDLMLREEYKPTAESTLGFIYFEHKHLPRLAKKTVLAAVEIHRKVIAKPYFNYLKPIEILNEKRTVEGILIPKSQHLLEHNVLNLQLNDRGNFFNYISFRMAYDTIVILKKHPKIDIQSNHHKSLFHKYFLRHSLFIKSINLKPTSIRQKIYLAFLKFKMKHQWFSNFWNRSLFYIDYSKFLLNRFWLFLLNNDYRIHIMKNRKRIYSEHKKKLFI